MTVSNPIQQLEQRLCDRFGRRFCCATGRGASALYCALAALPVRSGKVIIPDIVCPTPASVSLFANIETVFCDVRLSDFNIDPASIERVCATTDDVVAVMPVHLYGQPCDFEAVAAVATKRGLYVIEDAAQAMGATYQDRAVGALGDVSIVSFGHTKILDAGGGGAVLTDNQVLAERIREQAARLPVAPSDLADRFAEYRHIYYALKPLAERNPRINELFLAIPYVFREMYLYRLESAHAEAIIHSLDRLDTAVAVRRRHARMYREGLTHRGIRHPQTTGGAVPWRYSILLPPGSQTRVTERLRGEGIDASNWYPPLHPWYRAGRKQDPRLFANAEFIANHVLNLWVDDTVTPTTIGRTCKIVLETLQEVDA